MTTSPEYVICVCDGRLGPILRERLRGWLALPVVLITPRGAGCEPCPPERRLLQAEDAWVEDCAIAVIKRARSAPGSLLLVSGGLDPAARAAAHGVLLAERVWCEEVLPTVVADVDLNVGRGQTARRARLASQELLIRTATAREEFRSDPPALAVWDLLSGKGGLEQAVDAATRLVPPTISLARTRSRVVNAFVSRRTATYRHGLKGLMASLRIMEGAVYCGWLSKGEVRRMLEGLGGDNRSEPTRLSLIEGIKRDLEKLVPAAAPREWGVTSEGGLRVVVCDDDWRRSGWELLLGPLLRNRFGLDVEGVTSPSQLWDALRRPGPAEKNTALLLDVHYNDASGKEAFRVDGSFLRRLRADHPLLDVILFTSDLKDGALVRETYELGYRIFFKEMDERARAPEHDARKFVEVIEKSVRALPVRALQRVGEAGIADPSLDEATASLNRIFNFWRQDPEPGVAFSLTSLLEHEHRVCREYITGVKADPRLPVTWRELLDETPEQYRDTESFRLWARLRFVAKNARNKLCHDASLAFEAGSMLPSVGLSLPLVVAVTSLYRLRTSSNDPARQRELAESLRGLCRAVLISGQLKRPEAREFLEQAADSSMEGHDAEIIFHDMCKLVALNKEWVGDEGETQSLGKSLQDERYFLRSRIDDRLADGPPTMATYRWVCVLTAGLLLDHAKARFK